jgi:hypothetical protein
MSRVLLAEETRLSRQYGRFVDLYRYADPELQPAVREVRARFGRLAPESGT